MAKYSYAIIRRAIACKIMECKESKEWEFVDDLLDWAIYKELNTYHFIKFASETKDGYKFTFDKRITYVNEDINKIFESLFLVEDDEGGKIKTEESLKVNFIFHFLKIMDKNCNNFCLYNIEKNEIKKLPKINTCFNTESKYYFRLDNDNCKPCQLCLRPNPIEYKKVDISNTCQIRISDDNLEAIVNNEEIYKEDYNRILNRSFEYFIEYGTINEFEEIIKQCESDNFKELRIHLECNQKILKENKNGENTYQSIVKYKNVDKNFYIYKFKECFKKYFEGKIKLNDFVDKFKKNRKCAYCGVPENKLDLLYTVRSGRGNRLEYDRIISRDGAKKVEYKLENIVLACYWCNNAKTDTFSPKDFKPIAKGVNQVWNIKLKKNNRILHKYKKITFPEKSKIWKIKEN